ncbi:hypothetical protein LWI28_008717 [Acer negundo]|uniref:Uncharacterized protein n=1 Tax=Acer negundo TaxID=4023 RepID=A0AAD5IYF9_ACENE|nr:hypothetical protein LWI28_008717 [Acer negundo]
MIPARNSNSKSQKSGKKRKEIGVSKLTFDGKKKKGPEKPQNLREGLNMKSSVVAEEDLDLDPLVYTLSLDGIHNEDFHNHHECCIEPTPATASDPTRFLILDDGKLFDIMEQRKPLKGPIEIARELKEQEEMAKEIELMKEQEEIELKKQKEISKRSWLILIKNEE